ncbi:MAG: hypothetical protein M1814_005770, partial [Vezdaea aestivalis]
MATAPGKNAVKPNITTPPPLSSASSLSPPRTMATPELSYDDESSEAGSIMEGIQMKLGLDDAYEIMCSTFSPEPDYAPKCTRDLVSPLMEKLWSAWNFEPVQEGVKDCVSVTPLKIPAEEDMLALQAMAHKLIVREKALEHIFSEPVRDHHWYDVKTQCLEVMTTELWEWQEYREKDKARMTSLTTVFNVCGRLSENSNRRKKAARQVLKDYRGARRTRYHMILYILSAVIEEWTIFVDKKCTGRVE